MDQQTKNILVICELFFIHLYLNCLYTTSVKILIVGTENLI